MAVSYAPIPDLPARLGTRFRTQTTLTILAKYERVHIWREVLGLTNLIGL
jgi:hypothetical protein